LDFGSDYATFGAGAKMTEKIWLKLPKEFTEMNSIELKKEIYKRFNTGDGAATNLQMLLKRFVDVVYGEVAEDYQIMYFKEMDKFYLKFAKVGILKYFFWRRKFLKNLKSKSE